MNPTQRPSKQFIKRGVAAISVVAFVLVIQTDWFQKIFTKKDKQPAVATLTVGDVVSKDSNGNGIPDWEEKLWGLDPSVLYTNGVSNKEIITAKKKAAGIVEIGEENLNETDRIARQLFTVATALGQSESIDEATLENIAGSFSSSIDIKRVDNHYSLKNVKTVQTSVDSLRIYYRQLNSITNKYDKEMSEVDTLVYSVENFDYSGVAGFTETAKTYRQISEELSKISTPIGVAQYHLDIINSFYAMSESMPYLQAYENNSIYGLTGFAIYRNNSTRLDLALMNLGVYLREYGIL